MKVRQVYRPQAACVSPADSLRDAARKMRSSGQSCLPVLDGSSLTGIITERALVEAAASGVPPSQVSVADYSHDGSVTVSLEDDCVSAELKMLAIGCRNLPVMDCGRLVGTVSMRDVRLKAAALATAANRRDGWPYEPDPGVDAES
ncbi:MAG TPA: CBS domain-containing protein [Candidatus Dormibacteraeota bacterium]|nr:CBS domain-containing protein [Candidatus Dormibacteraeota bacterium]